MKGTDKFLFGIVIGAVLLAAIAFGVAMTRPEPSYQADDTPEGVAHNYLLALLNEDFARAYGYLSPMMFDYPADVEEFEFELEEFRFRYNLEASVSLSIASVEVRGQRATVEVSETTFYQGGLFDSSQFTRNFDIGLELEDGEWKITNADSYFAWCWDTPEGCQSLLPPTRP